jgi:ATP-binding cassette, subfamily F, member 3
MVSKIITSLLAGSMLLTPMAMQPEYAALTMGELMQRRAKIADAMAVADAKWIVANEALEGAAG